LIWRILSLVALIINILIIFEVLWIDVSLIMAWISLWIWFAIETMIWNIVAWFFIILNKKFKIWDSVELLGRFNTKGVIEEINLKHTIIRLIDKRRLLIPNKIMADTAIKTNKSEKVVRWDFSISVPRHVNVDQVKNIIKDTVNSNENVLDKDYTTTYIKWFDSKWYNFNTIFFVDPSQVSPFIAWTKIRKSLFDNFKKYWINFTYEHMTIDFE
jgi:small-conductance mechanosensitive channel